MLKRRTNRSRTACVACLTAIFCLWTFGCVFSSMDESATSTIDIGGLVPDGTATSTSEFSVIVPPADMPDENATSTEPAPSDQAPEDEGEDNETPENENAPEDADNNDPALENAANPLNVFALWQMAGYGLDDDIAPGAQFAPSGKFEIDRPFTLCAIASNSLDENNPVSVSGQVFYPPNIGFGNADPKNRQGCGQETAPACQMQKITATEGFDLFCEKIQKGNPELPNFAPNLAFVDLCSSDGKLLSETAAVYCCSQTLAYDDVSGEYDARVTALNSQNTDLSVLSNSFTYIPVTAYELDFSHIDYGSVKENDPAICTGDGTWDTKTATGATIRNTGNTRLKISVLQDDMGLGKTGDQYNISFAARLGLSESWVNYHPFETANLPGELDLSQSAPLDFNTIVKKFPEVSSASYQGTIEFTAEAAPHYGCIVENIEP